MRLAPRIAALAPVRPALAALALGALGALSPIALGGDDPGRALIALRAGTIHLVEQGTVLEGGATILIQGGRILSAGKDLAVPGGAEVVDYGPDAVIVPGFVAADSTLATGLPSARTADPGLSAVDGFDFYARNAFALSGGVTSVYVTPARMRLIAGRGAIVKLGPGDRDDRVLRAAACVHGALSAEARTAPGFWEPPVPATSEHGLGVAEPQLPRSLVGAVVALRELMEAARSGGTPEDERTAGGERWSYGPYAAPELAELLQQRIPWRLTALDEAEIRAALAFASEHGLALILDGADRAAGLAEEISRGGAAVVFAPRFLPEGTLQDRSRAVDARWPEMDVPARLAAAGVRVAIGPFAGTNLRDLRFAAGLASRGGLDPAVALRAVTLTPAEIYGVAGRVGSIAAGKDADFAVLNGAPLDPTTSVLATWIGGEVVWQAHDGDAANAAHAVVLEVDELHVGDGRVMRPGQLLLKGGKIAEVAERVAHPRGATVVRGRAAMPGAIDALGHLGLGDSSRSPGAEFKLSRLVAPGETADRKVARAGVTTVALAPRRAAGGGSPVLAYKPAAPAYDGLVIREPAGLRLRWSERDRIKSGEDVRALLDKAKKYQDKWLEYEKAIAQWKPDEKAGADEKKSAGEGEKKDGEAGKDDEKKPEDGAEAKDGEKKDGDKKEGEEAEGDAKKDDKAKKKKGKEEDLPEPADPVTGVWEAKVARPPFAGEAPLRLALKNEAGALRGSLRCAALSQDLIALEGKFEKGALSLWGIGSEGLVQLQGEIAKAKLTAAVSLGTWQQELTASQTSTEYPMATRPERRKPKDEEPKAESGGKKKPEPPRVDEKLEPIRQGMLGRAMLLVEVERADEIAACVDAFQAVGIRPVLLGAEEAYKMVDRLRGRVAGVLLSLPLLRADAELGTNVVNRYAELQDAGIPVAFHSAAEEGAADLPLRAAFAVSHGMSPVGALRALTADAARMLAIGDRVGRLETGLDADVLLLDGSPLDVRSSVVRVWVNGREVLP